MNLELKIPPVLIVIITSIAMMAVVQIPVMTFTPLWLVAVSLMILGILVIAIAVAQFAKEKTTVNPTIPNSSSKIVATGIFAYSRNPMYVGMTFMLTGLAIGLGSMLALLFVIGFVLYITHFQICPEERILTEKFGDDYLRYCTKVRRWI